MKLGALRVIGSWIQSHIIASVVIGVAVVGGSVVVGSNVLSSNDLKGNIETFNYMRFILPNEFEEKKLDWTEGQTKYYEYKSSSEDCKLQVRLEGQHLLGANQNTREWILDSYYFNDEKKLYGTYLSEYERSSITEKVINKRDWLTFTVADDRDDIYVYVIEYEEEGNFYQVAFDFNKINNKRYDKSSYCTKAHNTIVNTLDFK